MTRIRFLADHLGMAMQTLTRNSIRFESSALVFNRLTESTTRQRRELLSNHSSLDIAFLFQGHMAIFR
ncbi:MAG: hypothetical protein NTX48_02555 [Planctomycetales bacterium]|nr:hypothetical protein [Planctomycetales bacterium]